MYEKYGNSFEIIFQKKFWPHIDGTGGFFVAKIRKLKSLEKNNESNHNYKIIEESWNQSIPKSRETHNKELKIFRGNISPWHIQVDIILYEHGGKILAVKNDTLGSKIRDSIFLMRYGEQI